MRAASLNFAGAGIGAQLPDGRYLRVGKTPPEIQRSGRRLAAEIFDAAQGPGGKWTAVTPPAGNLVEAAVSLQGSAGRCGTSCGKVLVQVVYNWQLFDPSSPSSPWSSAGKPAYVRGIGATANLLTGEACGRHCGKVLLTGGFQDYSPAGIRQLGPSQASSELYDPKTDSWSLAGSLDLPRLDHAAIQLNGANCGTHCGKVLVAGGLGTETRSTLFDPDSGNWQPGPDLLFPRTEGHTATLLKDGRVLVAGGGGQDHGEAEVFDPRGDSGRGSWSAAGKCNCIDYHSATRLLDGSVLLVGDTVGELFNPIANSWSRTEPLRDARLGHTAALLTGPRSSSKCGNVLVAGGNKPPLASSEMFISPTEPGETCAETNRAEGGALRGERSGRLTAGDILLPAFFSLVMAGAGAAFIRRRREAE